MRERWLSRRAFLLHFLLVTVVPGCLLAGWWQVHRALSGNLLSYFYSVEWPIFALLGVVAWWQLLHDRPTTAGEQGLAHEGGQEGASAAGQVVSAPARKSWLYHQDESEGRAVVWQESLEAPELAEYNRYLKSLSAGRAKKTWRNPHGLPAGTVGGAGTAAAAGTAAREEAVRR